MLKKIGNFKYFLFTMLLYLIFILLLNLNLIQNYHIKIIDITLINIILTVSLNLVVGFLGQLALGHAGFMAIGAYTSAILTTYLDLPAIFLFPISIILSGLLSSFFAFIIGIPALRLKGDYLAIITLGFGEIIRNIILNLKITKGARGFNGIKTYVNDYNANIIVNFSIIFFICAISIIVIKNLTLSRHGRAIKSISEDEIASEASGINTTYYKIFAFSFAAFFAGVAGSLYAHHSTILSADLFGYNKSIEIIIMVVLGGMGNILGSIISAIFLTLLPELLMKYAKYRMLIYSILLIITMLLKNSNLKIIKFFDIKNLLKKIKKARRL